MKGVVFVLGRSDDGEVRVVIDGSLVFLGVLGVLLLKDCLKGFGLRFNKVVLMLGGFEK